MNKNEENQRQETESSCQLYRRAIEFIGKRWTGMIIYQLLDGPMRYHELLSSIEGISDRLLSERLKDLEQEGLLIRRVLANSPKKVEYKLTEPGYEFHKVFIAIIDWAEKQQGYLKQQ